MKCIEKKELEIFVINEIGGTKIPQNISDHFLKCNFCANRIKEMRLFYNEFMSQNNLPYSESEMHKVEMILRKKNPIIKTKLVHNINQDYLKNNNYTIMHAETSNSGIQNLYENYAVLSSEDNDLLIRIIRNKRKDDFSIHLISEDEKKYSNVIIHIDGIDEDFVTDKNGFVNIGHMNLNRPELLNVVVNTPISEFELKPFDLNNEVIITNDTADSIKIEFLPGETNHILKVQLLKIKDYRNKDKLKIVFSMNDDMKISSTTENGIVVFHEVNKKNDIKIKVFS